jgi:hypothetical protein
MRTPASWLSRLMFAILITTTCINTTLILRSRFYLQTRELVIADTRGMPVLWMSSGPGGGSLAVGNRREGCGFFSLGAGDNGTQLVLGQYGGAHLMLLEDGTLICNNDITSGSMRKNICGDDIYDDTTPFPSDSSSKQTVLPH